MNSLLKVLTLFTFLFCCSSALCQVKWDTLYLLNGQVVFGELKSFSNGRIDFDAEGLVRMNIKYSKVNTIVASRNFYRIETIDHKVFYSVIKYGFKEGTISIGHEGKDSANLPIRLIDHLTIYSGNASLWEGNVSAGYSYSRSSEIGRLNFDASLKNQMRTGELSFAAATMVTQNENKWNRDRENVQFNWIQYLKARWRFITLAGYQRNLELGLARRFQEGAGAGFNYLTRPGIRGGLITGLVINQEKSITSSKNLFSAEWPLLVTFNFFRFSNPDLNMITNQSVYLSLSEKGRVRHDGEVKLEWKVISDFTVNLKVYDSYDSKPTSLVAANFDYGIVFGFGYKFE